MTASVTHDRAMRYAEGSARGLLHHHTGHCRILLLRNIAQGMLLLSLLLIIFFMIEGMSKIVFALTIRPLPNWLWVFASGALSVVLSLVLFAAMPVTALWLIGLMLGLDLIAIGAALGAMAWRLRGQAAPAA